jgi:uncharacterized membrane protein
MLGKKEILLVLGILLVLVGILLTISSIASPVHAVPACQTPPCPTYSPTYTFTWVTALGIVLMAVGVVLVWASHKVKRASEAPPPPIRMRHQN